MAGFFNQGTCHIFTVFFDGFSGLKQRSFNGGIFNQGTCLQSFLDNFFRTVISQDFSLNFLIVVYFWGYDVK